MSKDRSLPSLGRKDQPFRCESQHMHEQLHVLMRFWVPIKVQICAIPLLCGSDALGTLQTASGIALDHLFLFALRGLAECFRTRYGLPSLLKSRKLDPVSLART